LTSHSAIKPTSGARTPAILPLAAPPPPSFVGPPSPTPEELEAVRARSAARAAARLKAAEGVDHLPNPFAEPGEPDWVNDFRPTQQVDAPLARARQAPGPVTARPAVTPPPRPKIEDPLAP
jgi:hypothetical protein